MEADTPVLWESLGKETQVLTRLRKPPLSWDNSGLCPSVQEQSSYSLNPNQKKRGGGEEEEEEEHLSITNTKDLSIFLK